MKNSKSLLKVTALSIAALHGINKLIDSFTAADTNSKSNGKYYHWKHGSVFYRKTGNGEPLLLIHDLTVFSSNYEWSQIIDTLAEHHTVYALDLIGCGKSDKPEITYTNYFYVQMISDFIKEVIGEPVDVTVTGLSSSFVLMANSINKDIFKDITIISPKNLSALRNVPDNRSKLLIKLFNLPIIGKTAYYIATNKENTEYYLTEKCYYNPFHIKAPVVKAYHTAAHMANGSGKMLLASIEGGYLNIDISNALKNAENQITIITGEHAANIESIISSYTKLNPAIAVKKIPDTRYLPQLEAPDFFIEAL